ncbi:MAG: hypothetical protein JXR64_13250, partial [Spirochaetales bacterium]|nr:hypothetical protein [Spirochaetales bacterium]
MIIKRARGHRLYTTKGEKILDLYMDNGRAVLGHRPNGLSLTLKNSIERGLYANYPNIYLNRLVKDLKKRFPAFTYFAILENEDKLSRIIPNPIDDPLFTDCSNSNIAYWRPFLEVPNTNYLVLLYPFPGLNSVTIVVSKEPLAIENDNISPILLSGIVKSFYEYDMALKEFNPNNYS